MNHYVNNEFINEWKVCTQNVTQILRLHIILLKQIKKK